MKHPAVFVLALVFAACGIACGHHGDHADPAGHGGQEGHGAQDSHPAATEEHGSHGAVEGSPAAPGLVLNGAEKWPMDAHTRTLFARMVERLEGTELEVATSEALKASGVTLRKDIDDLIAGCTMVGDAHNELHKYLTAYIPAVNELKQSGDPDSAEKVRELLGVYPDFFE